jgi:pilus assembly protein CpaB
MRGKSLALLVLALGCGLVASIGITQVMGKRNADPVVPTGETETVFVALKDIGLGDILSGQVLRLEQWPKDKIPSGALTKMEDVEGRRTRTKLYAGEPILDNKLFRRGTSDQGPDALIPKGYRVVSVKVDSVSGAASLLLPGTRVDVMVYLIRDPQRGIQETSTRTILQDIRVFAVDDVVSLDSKDRDLNKSINAKTISLLVTPEQAAKVMLASEMGRVRLVMRSPEDDQQAKQTDARPEELFGKSGGSEREKETLVEKPAESPAGQRFLELLNAARAKALTVKPPPREPAGNTASAMSWTMRILQPGAINDVVLDLAAGDPNNPVAGQPFWTPHALSSAKGSAAAKDHAAAEPPADKGAEPPADKGHDQGNPPPAKGDREPPPDQPQERTDPLN